MVILSCSTCVTNIFGCSVFSGVGFELHCNSQLCSGMKEASSTTSKKKSLQGIYKPVCMPLLLQAADQIMVRVSWGFRGSCICQSLLVNIVSICIWKTLADSLNALINGERKLKLNRKSLQLTSEYYVFHEVCVKSLFVFKVPVMFWLSTVSFFLSWTVRVGISFWIQTSFSVFEFGAWRGKKKKKRHLKSLGLGLCSQR